MSSIVSNVGASSPFFTGLLILLRLQRLLLSSNGLASIPFPDKPTLQLVGISHLALSFNRLQLWHDIDALAAWCPNLESLMLGGNPLAVGTFFPLPWVYTVPLIR